jgi:Tol biopolymer transport system component
MLYEMIAGRTPFAGQNVHAIFHAIQTVEPEPLTATRDGVPAELDRISSRCMAKNPGERYRQIDDLIVDLTALRRRLESGSLPPAELGRAAPTGARGPAKRRTAWRAAAIGAAAIAAVAAVILTGTRIYRHGPEGPQARTVKFAFTPSQLLRGGSNEVDAEVSISRDGRHIAYVESKGRQLWVRDIDEEQARPVPGATGVYQAFWSPDNQSIGYATGPGCSNVSPCDLVKLPAQGGTPALIAKMQGFRRASWSTDGATIVFCDSTGLYTVPTLGGTPTPIVIHSHIEHPSFLDLPNGRHAFLYQAVDASHPGGHGIWVQMVGESQRRFVILSASGNPYPVYSPSGHIIYVDIVNQTVGIWALPFSLATLEATGKPFPIAQRGSSPAMSHTGTLVYSDVPSNRLQMKWVDRSGREIAPIGEPEAQDSPLLSPDGKRLAVRVRTNPSDIWLIDLERGIKSRFTLDGLGAIPGAWSTAGLTYATFASRSPDIFLKPTGADSEAILLAGTPLAEMAPDWSPDQRYLIYEAQPRDGKSALVYRERGDGGKLGNPVAFLKTAFNERAPRFSPDGRFVAYTSDESGRPVVYVRDFPTATHRWQISENGGAAPRWRRDGKELYYLETPRLRIMAVPVTRRPDFAPGAPQPLFEAAQFAGYDVSTDGKKFVVLGRPAGESPLAIHIVHNWFEEFRGK